MRICLLIDDYSADRPDGGAQNSTNLMIDEFKRRGHVVVVVTAGPSERGNGLARSEVDPPVEVTHIRSPSLGLMNGWVAVRRPRTSSKIRAAIEAAHPDIVQAHVIHNYMSIGLLKGLREELGVPVVASVHDHSALCRGGLRCKGPELAAPAPDLRMPSGLTCFTCQRGTMAPTMARQVIRTMSRSCDAATFVSGELRDFYVVNGLSCATSVIYAGQAQSEPPAGRPVVMREPLIVAGGRLKPGKGFDRLIDEFASIPAAQRAGWSLAIYGRAGGYQSHLESRAQEVGIDASTSFLGLLQRDELHELLLRASIGVVPSVLADALPRALYEYMGVGLATIGSTVGGMREILEDGQNGLLVNPWRKGDLRQALENLIATPSEREQLGRRGLDAIRIRYAASDAAESRLTLYSDLLRDRAEMRP